MPKSPMPFYYDPLLSDAHPKLSLAGGKKINPVGQAGEAGEAEGAGEAYEPIGLHSVYIRCNDLDLISRFGLSKTLFGLSKTFIRFEQNMQNRSTLTSMLNPVHFGPWSFVPEKNYCFQDGRG